MSQDRRVSFLIPVTALDALCAAARHAGRTPADLLRDAVVAALGRSRPRAAGPRGIADALMQATGWVDLQTRLRSAGLVLRAAADGTVALHDWPSDRFLMPGDAAGIDLAALTLRFRAPFPGFAGLALASSTANAALPPFASRRRTAPQVAASSTAAPATKRPLLLPRAARVGLDRPGAADPATPAASPRQAA